MGYVRSFGRHLDNTERDAKRRAMRELEEIIIGLPDKPGNHRRNIALDHLAKTKMKVMSDTAGTPAAHPDQIKKWIATGHERVLRNARAFLRREVDLIVEKRVGAPLSFERLALLHITKRLTREGPIDVHSELHSAAQDVRMDMMSDLGTSKISKPYLIEMLLREVCGLDGIPETRGAEAGDETAAIDMAHCLLEGINLEQEVYRAAYAKRHTTTEPTL